MRTDLTDITLVVDRSGSMISIKDDAQGGINTFIKEQAQVEGEALFSLVQFDTIYEVVHAGIPIKDVPEFSLVPRGATALLDAVGQAINVTGERLASMKEEDRPGLVTFVVVTDGQENSSKEFTREQIRTLIKHQEKQYNWKFLFLGADEASFDEAKSMGYTYANTAVYDSDNAAAMYANVSNNVKGMRSMYQSGETFDAAFTDEERKAMTHRRDDMKR